MKNKYGKVALVVGASSGVGKEIAGYLLNEGYKVYGTSRKATFPSFFEDKLQMIPLDVTNEESIKKAVDFIIEREKTIGVLVNCPGYGLSGAIEDTSLEEVKAIFNTNLFGIIEVCNQVLPYMRKQKNGLIVNISSVAGFISIPFQSMYSASKYALEAISEALRIEVKPFGVKVSLIEPGDMKTNFQRVYTNKAKDSDYAKSCERAVNEMIKSESNGPGPIVVVKEFKKIINSKNPPIRRVVGFQYKFIAFFKKIVPSRFVEFIVTKLYRV
ncbi:MAG: short-chain dehydrogenase/reductase [Haloplasmataceae bacterium]|nr:short-chain dehydrogenase/reductase [Haloplasmataceae bacterium]